MVVPSESEATIGTETRLCTGDRGRILHYGDFESAASVPEFIHLPADVATGSRVVLSRRVWQRTSDGRSARPVLRSASLAVERTADAPRARLSGLGPIGAPGHLSLQIMAFPLADSATHTLRGDLVVPPGGVLAFGYGVREETARQGGGPVGFSVAIDTQDSDPVELFAATLDPDGGDPVGWREATVDLSAWAGLRASLVFTTRRLDESGFSLPVYCDPIVYARPRPTDRPNVILVSLDTLRARSLGAYGYGRDTSPFLDELAQHGAVFEQAMTASVTTSPAHMSLFTGLYPMRHGIREGLDRKAPGVVTLARRFRDAGYRTAAFTENGYLVRRRGFGAGFSEYTENVGEHLKAPGEARRTFAQARRWLDHHRDTPFFLFVHTYEVHSPYDPEPAYAALFAGDGASGPDDDAIRDARDRYDREIRIVDDELERLFESLAAAGLDRDTIVAIVSDHGEEFAEHGGFQHGGAVFEESVGVPLIFVAPGRIDGPIRDATPVSIVDVAPTLLDLAGIDALDRIDGTSLAGVLAGDRSVAERSLLAEARAKRRWIDPTRNEAWNPPLIAVRRGHEKFIVHRPERGPADPMLRFDLANDPDESRPLPIDTERRREIDALVDRYLGRPADAPVPREPDVSPELRDRLRALGYAE
jgi:arylsulfatase A-like enzyme